MSERFDRIIPQQYREQYPEQTPAPAKKDASGHAIETPVASTRVSSSDLTSETLREVFLEIRALADAAGHPCMMVNPEVVAQLAEERLLARQRKTAENAARPRRSA